MTVTPVNGPFNGRPPSAPPRQRTGMSLVELLAALPVVALIGIVTVALLLAAHRDTRWNDTRLSVSHELRHAAAVLSADLRPLDARDLVAATDTSLEFDAAVGEGVACGTRGATRTVSILLPPAGAPTGALTGAPGDAIDAAFMTPAQDGDSVAVWLTTRDPLAAPQRFTSTVTGIGTGALCATSPLRGVGARTLHLTLRDSLPAQPKEGSPVRLTRRTRVSLYRASDGLWYLGRRTRDAAVWDVTQPVAGPFTSHATRGLRFELQDSLGVSTFGPSLTAVVTVRARMRAPRSQRPGALTDSTELLIALRRRSNTP